MIFVCGAIFFCSVPVPKGGRIFESDDHGITLSTSEEKTWCGMQQEPEIMKKWKAMPSRYNPENIFMAPVYEEWVLQPKCTYNPEMTFPLPLACLLYLAFTGCVVCMVLCTKKPSDGHKVSAYVCTLCIIAFAWLLLGMSMTDWKWHWTEGQGTFDDCVCLYAPFALSIFIFNKDHLFEGFIHQAVLQWVRSWYCKEQFWDVFSSWLYIGIYPLWQFAASSFISWRSESYHKWIHYFMIFVVFVIIHYSDAKMKQWRYEQSWTFWLKTSPQWFPEYLKDTATTLTPPAFQKILNAFGDFVVSALNIVIWCAKGTVVTIFAIFGISLSGIGGIVLFSWCCGACVIGIFIYVFWKYRDNVFQGFGNGIKRLFGLIDAKVQQEIDLKNASIKFVDKLLEVQSSNAENRKQAMSSLTPVQRANVLHLEFEYAIQELEQMKGLGEILNSNQTNFLIEAGAMTFDGLSKMLSAYTGSSNKSIIPQLPGIVRNGAKIPGQLLQKKQKRSNANARLRSPRSSITYMLVPKNISSDDGINPDPNLGIFSNGVLNLSHPTYKCKGPNHKVMLTFDVKNSDGTDLDDNKHWDDKDTFGAHDREADMNQLHNAKPNLTSYFGYRIFWDTGNKELILYMKVNCTSFTKVAAALGKQSFEQ